MSRRAAARLAWSLCLLGIALNLVVGGLLLLGGLPVERANPWGTTIGGFFAFPVAMLAFGLVGALLASRLPRNPVGWICLSVGLNLMLYAAADHLAYALMTRPGYLSVGEYMAWFVNWSWVPAVGLLGTFLVLLFPNGRLPTRRWRPVAWLSGAVLVLGILPTAFSPGPMSELVPNVINPIGIEPARSALEVTYVVFDYLLPLCFVASAASMIVRFRRSAGVERQQLKWFASAAALLAISFPMTISSVGLLEDFITLIFASLPIAVGIAILRYRLYNIDRVINRALVYGALTVMLAGTYLGSVVVLQYLFRALTGGDSQLVVVVSTLAVAALFNPLRRRIQEFIDRSFYRRKYDAARTLEAFGARLRDETDMDELNEDLVAVVRGTVQPSYVSLWLRPSDGGARR